MWSDNETLSDCIDFRHLIGAVTGIIDNPDLLPCSVGIFGDWGSGKSSLMKMIEEKYAGTENVLIIRFNGWLFEGYEDAKTVLMGRIVDEIISNRTLGEKALKAAGKLLKRIDLMKLSGSALKYGVGFATMGPIGLAAVSGIDIMEKLKDVDYEKYIKERKETQHNSAGNLRTNIQEFHENFDELIKETNIEKIVVLIDDLDRCSPDTIIGTLEAIKLFLFTKGTAFVIGADERLIKYAVRRRFPEIPGDATEVGRDYLEKLIQYPIRIPALNTVELTNYVNLLFAQLNTDIGEFELARENILAVKQKNNFDFVFNIDNADKFLNSINEELKESFQLSSQVVPILSVGLNGNPRQCKRFLNALLIRANMAKSVGIELNKRILAKLMLLEYFKPETFNSFHQLQSENGGMLPNIALMEKLAKPGAIVNEENEEKKLLPEQEAYLQDAWLKRWIASEPTFQQVDLAPYYYFSRDKLAIAGLSLQRMSPGAQEFYRKVLSEAESIWLLAITNSKILNEGDASAIFEALTQKIREQGKQTGDNSLLRRLFLFCKERQELMSQLIGFIEKFPDKDFPASVVTWLQEVTQNNQYKPVAKGIVQKWEASKNNTLLSKISKSKLKDFE